MVCLDPNPDLDILIQWNLDAICIRIRNIDFNSSKEANLIIASLIILIKRK
jgi:hypothetical protein